MLQIDKEIAGALITVVIFGALNFSEKREKPDDYEHEQSLLRYIFSRFKPVFELKSQQGEHNTIDLPQHVIDSTISEILYPGLSAPSS